MENKKQTVVDTPVATGDDIVRISSRNKTYRIGQVVNVTIRPSEPTGIEIASSSELWSVSCEATVVAVQRGTALCTDSDVYHVPVCRAQCRISPGDMARVDVARRRRDAHLQRGNF